MNNAIDQMLSTYRINNSADKKNALKEVVQEIVLCGLSRGGFFEKAAFYGGTALRIFYGLDRFSEDLDFSLTLPDNSFDFDSYLPMLEKELTAWGLNLKVESHEKSVDSDIRSAFVKGNTREHLLLFFPSENIEKTVAASDIIKIKFEVDTTPPMFASFEHKYRLLPMPYDVLMYDAPSLFAGKIHAVLCRSWKNRVKGRDLYDYLFYLSRNIPVNLRHLNARLEDSGFAGGDLDAVKKLLKERFGSIDFNRAKQDVFPFIKNPSVLDAWSSEMFCAVTDSLSAD